MCAVALTVMISIFPVFAQGKESVTPFRQEGIASWYGAEFEGKATASGEIFDSSQLSAAHPTLPFGTTLRITNTQNGKMAVVRVNDRGPFVPARIIDVSRATAEMLDMLTTGTAPVVIEMATPLAEILKEPAVTPVAIKSASMSKEVGTNTGTAQILPAPIDATKNKRYRLQVGSYKAPKYAAEAFDKLKNVGLSPAYEKNGDNYRVVISEVPAAEVERLARVIGSAGFAAVLAREIP